MNYYCEPPYLLFSGTITKDHVFTERERERQRRDDSLTQRSHECPQTEDITQLFPGFLAQICVK